MSSRFASKNGRESAPGTRPAGVGDEREASRYVQQMFGRIAPRYDLLNRLLSLSLDRVWRRRAARRFSSILAREDARILDLCCGTGDLTLELARASERLARSRGNHSGARVTGADFAHPMLTRACKKWQAESSGDLARVQFCEADVLALPFADATFDLVTAAFGFRNLANYQAGLREIARVLRPGGEVGILEFAEPRIWPIAPLYRLYFTQLLPRIGGAISGSRAAYAYLPQSVFKFPAPPQLCQLINESGFQGAEYEEWTLGIVALHRARRR